jgi:mono/diheme cytochrome c family protein|tara:strand:- start:58 stop:372 length:315 start_codon:yes stop_codon:yes gene_type:complete
MKKIYLFSYLILFFSNPLIAQADSVMELGLEVYNNKAQCGVCHILQTAGSEGQIGPNLDQLKPQVGQIISAVTNGIGVMPAFEGILTVEEIEAVAYYVSKSTNK